MSRSHAEIVANLTIEAYVKYGLNKYGRPPLHSADHLGTPPPAEGTLPTPPEIDTTSPEEAA